MLEQQYNVLAQFMIAAYELRHREKQKVKDSLTFFRLISLYREFKWLRQCISENAYHQAIRELRFVIDSMTQAYYIDTRHPSSDMKCKLEIVKEVESLYGRNLIQKTDLTNKKQLEHLYGELCSYVHSSYKELLSSGPVTTQGTRLQFEPDLEIECLCEGFVNRTMDAMFLVSLSLFPEIMGPQIRFQKMRTSIIKSWKELGFKLALSKCKHK